MKKLSSLMLIFLILIAVGFLGTTTAQNDERAEVLWVIDLEDHSMLDEGEIIPSREIVIWHSYDRVDIIYRDAQNESHVHYERLGTRVSQHRLRTHEDAELIIRDNETGEEIFYQYHLPDTFRNRLVLATGLEQFPTLFTNFLAFLGALVIVGIEFWKYEKEAL